MIDDFYLPPWMKYHKYMKYVPIMPNIRLRANRQNKKDEETGDDELKPSVKLEDKPEVEPEATDIYNEFECDDENKYGFDNSEFKNDSKESLHVTV